MSSKKNLVGPIQSTAGAIPVKNDKGQVSMQKVKVHRYISGKRPDYAPRSSSEEESEDEEFIAPIRTKPEDEEELQEDEHEEDEAYNDAEQLDPRLRRLQLQAEARNRRRIERPELLESDEESEEEERPGRRRDSDSESGEEDLDDVEAERRRAYIRQRALEKHEEEVMAKEEEKVSGSEQSESEYEEYTDSEEEARPRLKPVFVFKNERVTLQEKEEAEEKERLIEESVRQRQQERRKETLKIVEQELQKEKEKPTSSKMEAVDMAKLEDVNTDDETEEAEYEAWKIRELKRVKRDREEREAIERERHEIDRLHGMTEEERRMELKMKPKQVTNKTSKGKYKFLQKYYHRGVFYLDKEEQVLRRDHSAPTLEDHFDKSILPKVMQVKNFGRSGRTKYTHLVDQDTTNFDSAWAAETAVNMKFHTSKAAGVRQVFDRPSTKKRRTEED